MVFSVISAFHNLDSPMSDIVSSQLLGPEGPIAKSHPAYETRDEQLRMAEAVEKAFFSSHNLVVEGGTGVGKSFAYLVPAILAAKQADMCVDRHHPHDLAPGTAHPQGYPVPEGPPRDEFQRGTGQGALELPLHPPALHGLAARVVAFRGSRRAKELNRVIDWAYKTEGRHLSDLDPLPSATSGKRSAPTAPTAGAPAASTTGSASSRRRAASSARRTSSSPTTASSSPTSSCTRRRAAFSRSIQAVVFDEAHSVEMAACEHFGIDISNSAINYLLNQLYNPSTGKGFLTVIPDNALRKLVEAIHSYSEGFFAEVIDWLDTRAPSNGRVEKAMGDHRHAERAFERPRQVPSRRARRRGKRGRRARARIVLPRSASTSRSRWSGFIANQQADDFASWVERSSRRGVHVTLNAAPISVADYMREFLFKELDSAVFTSATLAVGR